MFNKLYVRFILIFVIVALCGAVKYCYPLKEGIDLAGGIDLVYELDLSKMPNADPTELAKRLIETLQKRVDPWGQKNLTWRVVGQKRIEIQMPLATKETQLARKQYNTAEESLLAMNLRPTSMEAAFRARDRAGQLDKLAAPGSERRRLLDEAAAAYDALEKADAETRKYTPKQLEEKAQLPLVVAKVTAEDAYRKVTAQLMADNVPLAQLDELFDQADNPKDKKAALIIDDMLKKTKDPWQHQRFEALIAARDNLRKHQGGGFDDPNDLKRLLKGRGVLDFRIAPTLDTKDQSEADAIRTALDQFREVGPRKAIIPNMRWFEIDPKNGADLAKASAYYVTAVGPNGDWYILLYTDWTRALFHDGIHPDWRLNDSRVQRDQDGKIIVAFSFDNIGGNYFAELTTSNVKRPMAILLDDRVISAPNINTPIVQGSGIITFGDSGGNRTADAIEKEARTLVAMLEAGSLPAALQPEPVSETTMSPSFGEDNIKAGETSGIIAVLAVMAFMVVYYTLTGSFADIALMINLLMTLAIMCLFSATLTLPGIAGIVLTLGMAVDANVLINERIREEVHRGASTWMAVRQGYDKVFWTIFDANTTTSLTSVVLIFYGSAEVKGFGVTLLIGLMVHMFTALFVTRTFMMAAVKWGLLRQIDDKSIGEYFYDLVTLTWLRKGEWPFMRVITVSNFDWIGKRHIFWIISAILTVAGIYAFWQRGTDKYDTEFKGGTKIVFRFKEGSNPSVDSLEKVRHRVTVNIANFFHDKSSANGDRYDRMARDVGASSVVKIEGDNQQQQQYEVVTGVAGPEDVRELQDEIVHEFSDVLQTRQAIHFAQDDRTPEQIAELTDASHAPVVAGSTAIVRPIDTRYLDEIFPGLHAAQVTQGDLTDMRGGVAIYISKIDPPVSVTELEDRLARMRHQPDKSAARYRDSRVIPIAYAPDVAARPEVGTLPAATGPAATAASKTEEPRLVTSAVVVSADPNIAYTAESIDDWRSQLAKTEWDLVRSALNSRDSLEGVTSFDPVVANTARTQAIISLIISLILIIIYVWIRFGGFRYGIGAILSLVHDAIIAVAATVLSGWVYSYVFHGRPNFLLINDFKINLTMIAAYLTVIGYSVNDTIVIFDRIRENRGRAMLPLTSKLVNDSINQCFGRTIWTTFTVFIVVLIMYIWGGEGVHGFSFAMLVGVITGAYSTLAIASPALLNVKERARSKVEMSLARQDPQ